MIIGWGAGGQWVASSLLASRLPGVWAGGESPGHHVLEVSLGCWRLGDWQVRSTTVLTIWYHDLHQCPLSWWQSLWCNAEYLCWNLCHSLASVCCVPAFISHVFHVFSCSICFHSLLHCDLLLLLHDALERMVDPAHLSSPASSPGSWCWCRSSSSNLFIIIQCWSSSCCQSRLKVKSKLIKFKNLEKLF